MSNPQALAQIILSASTDPIARKALVGDTREVLAAGGFPVPSNTKITVHVNDGKTFHAVLPQETPGEIEAVRKLNPLAATVYEKAWRDPAYKQHLMTAPREAFVAATGVKPPAALHLVAHENTANELHIVVPYIATSSELSDADLEQVAGGKGAVAVAQACNEAVGYGGAMVGLGIATAPVGGPVSAVVGLAGVLTGIGAAIGSAVK